MSRREAWAIRQLPQILTNREPALSNYEQEIKRGLLHSRSSRLKALVEAIDQYIKSPRRSRLLNIELKLDQWKRDEPKEFANRGKNPESQLRKEIANLIAVWGKGEIRVVDPGSHPRYEPHKWNDNSAIQNSTNCYAYACDDRLRHAYREKPQPGQFAGMPVRTAKDMEPATVRYRVMADDLHRDARKLSRLIPLVRLRNDPVPDHVVNVPGYYLIALVTAPGEDYHWLRQDDDGMWSHKPGWGQATNRDSDAMLIYDPRDAALRVPVEQDDRGNVTKWADYEFTTFYYAPRGGVRTGDLGVLKSRRMSIG